MIAAEPAGGLSVLRRIFEVFDSVTTGSRNVCREGCAACCTRNVGMTGLEGMYLLDGISEAEKKEVLKRIHADIDKERLIPKITINGMADLCMAGEDLPDEDSDPAWGSCPLLEDNRCLVYSSRPFSCRCMVSKRRCDETGFADMDDWQLTLNNIFMQYIEHIDQGGFYGNLSDILMKEGGGGSDKNLIVNQPVKMLMVPPEHRQRIQGVLEQLGRI